MTTKERIHWSTDDILALGIEFDDRNVGHAKSTDALDGAQREALPKEKWRTIQSQVVERFVQRWAPLRPTGNNTITPSVSALSSIGQISKQISEQISDWQTQVVQSRKVQRFKLQTQIIRKGKVVFKFDHEPNEISDYTIVTTQVPYN